MEESGELYAPGHFTNAQIINHFTPNDSYKYRTAPLTSKFAFYIFIQQI